MNLLTRETIVWVYMEAVPYLDTFNQYIATLSFVERLYNKFYIKAILA